jgi:hypothetical protein
MTKKDIERVSRSWAGHLATNPQVRKQFASAKTPTAKADLINDTVIPKDNVQVGDVPKIQANIQKYFGAGKPDATVGNWVTNVVKGGPPGT